MVDDAPDEITFAGQVVEWRGPAPFYFVGMPAEHGRSLHMAAKRASYGWGCVPVTATIERTTFRTSLFPKDGSYLLPLKAAVRRALDVAPGDQVAVALRIVPSPESYCCR